MPEIARAIILTSLSFISVRNYLLWTIQILGPIRSPHLSLYTQLPRQGNPRKICSKHHLDQQQTYEGIFQRSLRFFSRIQLELWYPRFLIAFRCIILICEQFIWISEFWGLNSFNCEMKSDEAGTWSPKAIFWILTCYRPQRFLAGIGLPFCLCTQLLPGGGPRENLLVGQISYRQHEKWKERTLIDPWESPSNSISSFLQPWIELHAFSCNTPILKPTEVEC